MYRHQLEHFVISIRILTFGRKRAHRWLHVFKQNMNFLLIKLTNIFFRFTFIYQDHPRLETIPVFPGEK